MVYNRCVNVNDSPQSVAYLRTAATEAKDAVGAAAQAQREANRRFGSALRALHDAGLTWAQVGEVVGMEAEAARQRSYEGSDEKPPSLRNRKRSTPSRPRSDALPGLSVAAAAERLGKSRQWVSRLAREGRIATIDASLTHGYIRIDPAAVPRD